MFKFDDSIADVACEFSRDTMTLRLLRARLSHSKRILMLQSTIKSMFQDDFVLLQACFHRVVSHIRENFVAVLRKFRIWRQQTDRENVLIIIEVEKFTA
jgi:hypothetical protein